MGNLDLDLTLVDEAKGSFITLRGMDIEIHEGRNNSKRSVLLLTTSTLSRLSVENDLTRESLQPARNGYKFLKSKRNANRSDSVVDKSLTNYARTSDLHIMRSLSANPGGRSNLGPVENRETETCKKKKERETRD